MNEIKVVQATTAKCELCDFEIMGASISAPGIYQQTKGESVSWHPECYASNWYRWASRRNYEIERLQKKLAKQEIELDAAWRVMAANLGKFGAAAAMSATTKKVEREIALDGGA
jgi:hypothetical protein